MIGQVNYGRLLPFYTSRDWQRHRLFGQSELVSGLLCTDLRFMPFQIPVSYDTQSVSWKLVDLVGGGVLPLSGANLHLDHLADGSGAFVSFLSDLSYTPPKPCGIYEIVVTAVDDLEIETEYYSEAIQVVSVPLAETEWQKQWWQIAFKNTVDVDGVMYQTGFENRLLLKMQPIFGTPEVKNTRDELQNGNGQTVTTFGHLIEKVVVEIPKIPDYALPFLAVAENLDTVTLKNLCSGTEIAIKYTFGFRREGVSWNTVTFAIETWNGIISGCSENMELI